MQLNPFVPVKNPQGETVGKEYNPLLDHIWQDWQNVDASNYPITLAGNAESGDKPISTKSDGAFEAETFLAQRTDEALIKIKDPGRKMTLMNDWVHLDTITGTALLPFLLPSSIYIEQSSALTVNIRDISGVANSIYFGMDGRKIYRNTPKPLLDKYFADKGSLVNTSFFLTCDGGMVTVPGGIGTGKITVQATVPSGFDFYIKKISGMQTAKYLVNVKHNGTPLTESPTHVDMFAGTGQFPKILREPHLIRRNERLEIEFTNLSAADNEVYLTFSGTANFLNVN